MKTKILNALLILSVISIPTLNSCEKKAPLIIYQTPAPNSNRQNTQQPQVAAPDTGTADTGEPVSDDSAAIEEPATPADDKSAEDPSAGQTEPTEPVATAAPADTTADNSLDIPDVLPSYAPAGGDSAGSASYTQSGSFNLYQPGLVSKIPLVGSFLDSTTTVNKWQAVGVAAFGSEIYITAQDKTGLSFFKGTVLKMSSEDGSGFTNLGSQWLGLKYQMDKTVKGIAMDATGNIYANDGVTFLYLLTQPAYSVQKINAGFADSIDIATVNNSVIVATSAGLKKYDTSLTNGSDFSAGVTPTGGIGSDKAGNLYVITSGSIKKITSTGTVSDFTTGVSGAIDVVGTDDGKVCVLTSEGIKMFDATGKLTNTFGQGDYTSGTAITASSKDLFVSDAGATYKDSKIVKYSIMSL